MRDKSENGGGIGMKEILMAGCGMKILRRDLLSLGCGIVLKFMTGCRKTESHVTDVLGELQL